MNFFKSSNFLRKAMALFLTAFLFFQGSGGSALLAESSGGAPTPAPAELTNLQFFLTPVGGSEIELPTGTDLSQVISQDSVLKIRYEFKTPVGLANNHGLIDWELPLSNTGGLDLSEITGEIHPDPINHHFTYEVDPVNQKIRVHFDPTTVPAEGADDFIEVAAHFSLNQASTTNRHTFVFPISATENKNFTLRFMPRGRKNNIEKDGQFYSTAHGSQLTHDDLKINPHEVKWTVDANLQLKTIPAANALVEDTFNSDQLTLRPETIKVYPLDVTMGGTIAASGPALTLGTDYEVVTDAATPGQFKIKFKDSQFEQINGSDYLTKAYRIEYITDIKPEVSGSNITLTNTAKLNSASAKKDVKIQYKRPAHTPTKSGYYVVNYPASAHTLWLRWDVLLNLDQQPIKEISDVFPSNLKLRAPFPGTTPPQPLQLQRLKPEALTKDKTKLTNADYETVDLHSVFQVNTGTNDRIVLTPLDPANPPRDVYRLRFDTSIHPGPTDPVAGQDTYTNSMSLTTYTGSADSTVSFNSTPVGPVQNGIGKWAENADYTQKTIKWLINIEPKASTMHKLIVNDTFPNKGLSLVENSVEIKQGSLVLVKGTDYILTNNHENGFTVEFKGTFESINHNVQITYKTTFDRNTHTDPSKPREYKNAGTYRMTGLTNPKTISVATFTVHPYVPTNGGKEVKTDWTTREMEWTIYANYNSESLDLKVKDEIGAGHELIEDSIKVYTYTPHQTNGKPQLGSEVTGTPVYTLSDITANGFTVDFPNTNLCYAIVYKTKMSDTGLSINKYENTAFLNGTAVKKEASFPNYDKFLGKVGKQQRTPSNQLDWYIDWSVKINQSLSIIHDAVIKDRLTVGQEYVADSFKLYTVHPTKQLVPASEYSVVIKPFDPVTGEQSMDLRFNNPIDREYLLEYSTLITKEQAPFTMSNEVRLDGTNVQTVAEQKHTTVMAVHATTTAGSQRPHSQYGSISILKKDKSNGRPLPNIVFELWKDNVLVAVFPATGADGKTKLNGLKPGSYLLKEQPDRRYVPLPDTAVEISTAALNLDLTLENTPVDPATPYNPPTPEPESPQSDNPPKDQPKPKDETPKDTPKPETPDHPTPSTPNDVPPVPTTPPGPNEGDIEIPNDHIPQIVIMPKHGKIELTGRRWKYTPNDGFYGKDSFTIHVTTPTGEKYDEEIEIDIPIPEGIATLPKTDGIPSVFYFLLGSACLALAAIFKKK